MADDFAWWRGAVETVSTGKRASLPLSMETVPQCGYYRILDRSGDEAGEKRTWKACAVWRDEDGDLRAELDGEPLEPPFKRCWPYCAKHPITYEEYLRWQETKTFERNQK